ncbi:hypothetical protein D6833_00825, partial [Candidatus Parcubacteria bacterium]
SYTHHLPNKLYFPRIHILEQQQISAIFYVITDGFIPSHKPHVTYAAFPGIQENIPLPAVLITILLALFACKKQNHRFILWRTIDLRVVKRTFRL